MKDFLKRHGEKVFLVVMALVCGWSLVGSVRSLGKPSVLPQEDQDAIARIRKQIRDGRPPPRNIAPYQEWLGANFDAHGIGKSTKAGPPPPERLVYGVPEKEGPRERHRPPVDGKLGLPGKLAVEASRARITVTWSAAEVTHARVDRYEVFGLKGKGERPEEPVGSAPGGAGPLSFIHSNLAPETTYSYWIRAVAKAAPPDN
ncbi:MAG: fibronectin type III domain-containing protein, partial [Planctomycetota bacterium]